MDRSTFDKVATTPAIATGRVMDQDTGEFVDLSLMPIVGLPHEVMTLVKVMLSGENHTPAQGIGQTMTITGDQGSRIEITSGIDAATMLKGIGKEYPSLDELRAMAIRDGLVDGDNPFTDEFPGQGNRVADVESTPPSYGTGMYL